MKKETLKHVLNILRRGTITWEGRRVCLNRTRVRKVIGKLVNGKDKLKYFYFCDLCKKEFTSSSDLEVDHIEEVGPYNGDFNEYIKRMYCDIDNLQNLCTHCHSVKTSKFNSFLRYKRKNLID